MIKLKHPTVQSIFRFVFFFLFLQIGNSAISQNITVPVYYMKSAELKKLLIKGDRSKLMVCLMIEKPGIKLEDSSSLSIFAFCKNSLGTKKRNIVGEGVAVQYKKDYNLDTTFFPFLIANTEIRIRKLLKNLPDDSLLEDGNFYFVPSFTEVISSKGKIRNLVFTLMYLLKSPTINNITDFKTLASSLTRVAALNPCPPARPADYR